MKKYVHGYSEKESQRLHDQAGVLDDLLHSDSIFPPHSRVLEAGCGVGSQTRIMALKNPDCRFVSIDIADESLRRAEALIDRLGIDNVCFQPGDINDLDFPDGYFDHVVVCFVLEHLADPVSALKNLKRVLKKNGSIMVIEGDHGSTYFHPDSQAARNAIDCQVRLQAAHGGNALIGRQLYPLLCRSGFSACRISPRMVYVDSSRPEWVDGFTRKTFTAMIEGVEKEALQSRLITPQEWKLGIQDLYRTTQDDGVFCYTFFKATAIH